MAELIKREMVDLCVEALDVNAEFLTLELPYLENPVRILMKSIAEITEVGDHIQHDVERQAMESQDWHKMHTHILQVIQDAAAKTKCLHDKMVTNPVLQEHIRGLYLQVARAAHRICEGIHCVNCLIQAAEKQFGRDVEDLRDSELMIHMKPFTKCHIQDLYQGL